VGSHTPERERAVCPKECLLGATGGSSRERDLNNIVAHGIQDNLADGMKIELAHDVGAVRLRGFDTHAENAGYFLGALAFCQELDDVPAPVVLSDLEKPPALPPRGPDR
jgi:hypothetical protein